LIEALNPVLEDDVTPHPETGFRFTPKQLLAWEALAGPATHTLLFGGSRSGKTFLLVWAVIIRAMLAPNSRHLICRFRFSHVKASIVQDTLPKVMELCFPEMVKQCHMNKTDWYYQFPNGAQIYFGGLDDKERTEKILGMEFATIYLNECSQIPWTSRNILVTRLAQKVEGLRLRAYYDCNPPARGHWLYKLFVEKRNPSTRELLPDEGRNWACVGPLNPVDNQENIAAGYMDELQHLPARARKRFLEGLFGDDGDNALWTIELLDTCRHDGDELPDMMRVVVAVDPSGASGPEDTRSDEIGIVVCGIGSDGKGYILADLSSRMGPAEWGTAVVEAYHRFDADLVVAEKNYGGAMVKAIITTAGDQIGSHHIKFREVTASKGKAVRAEPISALFEQDKIRLDGSFPELEDQMCSMTTAGYNGDKSPDRVDAMVWGLTQLFPRIAKKRDEFQRAPRVIVAHQAAKKYGTRRR
jgi:hypothetical protein